MPSNRARTFEHLPTENNRYRELIGFTAASLKLLVAVMSCEASMGASPTRKACAAVIGVRSVVATELLGLGYLDISAKNSPGAPLVATRRAWREFGFAVEKQEQAKSA